MSSLAKDRYAEGTLAALLLLGPLLLAIPGPLGPLHGAFTALELSGTGLILLASLPVAWFAVLRRTSRQTLGPFLAIGVWLSFELSAIVHETSDTLERDRALSLLVVAVVLCHGASSLRESGRAVLGRLLCLLSLLLLLPPLIEAGLGATRLFLSGGDTKDAIATLAGVLGNSGELSNAAIPGALFGVLLAARTTGTWKLLGTLAAGSLLLHAVFSPALTTLAAVALVGVFAAAASRLGRLPSARTRATLVFASIAIALAAGRFALRALPSGPVVDARPAPTATHSAPGSDLGGLAVREHIARSSLEAIADAPLLGHGPGQFIAIFPAYRDPLEIELSTHGRTLQAETEVEHPHSDLLLAFVEAGVIGGLCFLLLLLHALASTRRALARGDDTEAGLALGLGALVLVSFLHAPFLHHPLTSAIGFVLLGALSSPLPTSRLRSSRWFGAALAILLTAHAQRALAITRHGDALSQLSTEGLDAKRQDELVVEMLTACPDSVVARTRHARLLDHADGPLPERLAAWDAVLTLRPQRVEAWIQSGILLARDDQFEPARRRFREARILDPNHPATLRNLARVELSSARTLAGTDLLDELSELGYDDKLWRLRLATDLLLEGLHTEAMAVLERNQLRFRDLTAEKCYQLAIEYRRIGGDPVQARIADAFECTAHRLWARRHAELPDFDSARRSFRQAIRIARREDLSIPPRFELEFAAILWRSKMPNDAREAYARAGNDAIAWRDLPNWAGEALLDLQRTKTDD